MGKLVPWNKSPLEVDDIPVAIISLGDAGERRQTLIDRGFLPELVNNFWPACDMRGLADSELQNYDQYNDIQEIYNRPPVPAELGCFFSHSEIIRWLSEQDMVSQVVIFEDDVIPATRKSLEVLSELTDFFGVYAKDGNPYICHLGPRLDQWRSAFTRRVINGNDCAIHGNDLFELVDRKTKLWRAHAYIISKEAANRYVELANKTGFLADDWRFISDGSRSKVVTVIPPLFTQDEDVVSTIDPGNKRLLMDQLKLSTDDKSFGNGRSQWMIFGRLFVILKKIFKRSLVIFYRNLYGRKLF
ncbi:MAG: hypothetical protein COA68_08915 [Oceanobacter sp.]|nr:MAG: hypothetical protein COA68_08915 [Oceanobacter sp.]